MQWEGAEKRKAGRSQPLPKVKGHEVTTCITGRPIEHSKQGKGTGTHSERRFARNETVRYVMAATCCAVFVFKLVGFPF